MALPVRIARLLSLFALLARVTWAQTPAPVVRDLGLLPGDSGVATATQNQLDHAVAQGGSQCLVVWSDFRGQSVGGGTRQSAGDVFGIRLDAQGDPIDPAPFLIAGGMGVQERPLVAWNGTAWLVVFLSQDPSFAYFENRMRAVRVSAAGQALDPTPISFPPTQYVPNTVGMQVAGSNGQWLVTRCIYHGDGYGTFLAGQRIDADGALLDTTPLMLIDWIYGNTVSLAANGEYLVAGGDWNNFGSYRAQRVTQAGQLVGSPFSVPSLELASSGSEYYVVWTRDFVNIVGSRMTRTGTLLTPAGTMILANVTQFGASTLGHDGTRWWLEWGVNDQLHTVRISAAGSVLDPGGGPLLPLTIGGSANQAYVPSLAGRAGGGVLLFWYDYRASLNFDANVFVLPISSGNVAGSERSVSTGTRNQRAPDLAGGPGGQSAIAFVSEAANDRRVLLHLLDAAGRPTSPTPIEVANGPTIGRAAVAWNGTNYLVTWDGGVTGDPSLQIEARRLNADGSFVDTTPFDVMSGFSPDVEALGSDFLISCSRVTAPQTISAFMRIVRGPTAGFVNPPSILGGGYVSQGPRVRQDGARWIVTYESQWSHDSNQSDIAFSIVNPDGSTAAAGAPAGTGGGSGTPDVAFSGGKYLFVWRNNTLANADNYIAGRLMNTDGSFTTPPFVIAQATGRQLRPVVGWDGTQFLVAWDDQRNQLSFFDGRTDTYGARVSNEGVVKDPNGFPIHLAPLGDATVELLTHSDGSALVAAARFVTTPPFDSYRIGISSLGDAALGVPEGQAGSPVHRLVSFPNPFRSATAILFDLPRTGSVELAIHDLQGRLVRTLVGGGTRSEGRHSEPWDGCDRFGSRVAPGIYVVTLRSAPFSRSARVVLLER